MSADESTGKSVESRDQPPGSPSFPYKLSSLCGEIIYIPCSKSATRLLVTGKETDNAFAVVGTGGTAADPIGFHYHRETHDVFLCLKGQVNVWAGEKCRTMSAGDFASVPPNTIHQYQVIGNYTEFLGLIVPGGWEEFFRFIGEPYAGPLFPLSDNRNIFEVLIPKLKAAAEQFDMVPCPRHAQFDPQPWQQDENQLPGACEPYFLRNDCGPKYVLGGTVVRPLATTAESGDKFSIASIEGSSYHSDEFVFANSLSIAFSKAHHCFQVSDGSVEFTVSGSITLLSPGETIYIPSGTGFRFDFTSKFAKTYVFSNGAGISELFCKLGQDYAPGLIPEEVAPWNAKNLHDLQQDYGYKLS